jgi:hypothetical protein
MQTLLLSLLLNLVLSVGNVMLPIKDLIVDGRCIATTGGRRLFCIVLLCLYLSFCCPGSLCKRKSFEGSKP